MYLNILFYHYVLLPLILTIVTCMYYYCILQAMYGPSLINYCLLSIVYKMGSLTFVNICIPYMLLKGI